MKKTFISLLILFSSISNAEASEITIDELKTWHVTGDVAFEFYNPQVTKIYLTNHEKAFLVPVSINAGVNDMFQTALAIPAKREIILLIDTIVKEVEQVVDFDRNNVSEIYVKRSSSGQGLEVGEKAIVQLDSNGNVNVLINFDFSDNDGERGENVSSYHSEDVNWKFINPTTDRSTVDLIETITTKKGVQDRAPIVKKSINRYHFDGHKLIKLKP